MEQTIQIITDFVREEWSEIHHIESQRATLTNILLVVESAALGYIVHGQFAPRTIPVSILLTVCGALGVLGTSKYYERFCFAQTRLTELYKQLDGLDANARVLEILRRANEKHEADKRVRLFGYHLKDFRLKTLWILVHSLSMLCGLVLIAVAIQRGLSAK